MKLKICEYLLNTISMSKSPLKFTIISLSFMFFNCKQDTSTFNDYKYANQENVFVCDNLDTKLYSEALLSFEEDISRKYNSTNKDIGTAYSFFSRDAISGKADYQGIVSPHTMAIFEALKKDTDLWHIDNSINYNSKLLTCIGNNFQDKNLKTTFNALVSTNSMRPGIFGNPLINHVKKANKDKYMAAYVAFDLFYSHLFEVDPTKVAEKPKTKDETSQTSKDSKKNNSKLVEDNQEKIKELIK